MHKSAHMEKSGKPNLWDSVQKKTALLIFRSVVVMNVKVSQRNCFRLKETEEAPKWNVTGDPELDSFIIKIILGKLENLEWCLRNTRNGSKSFSHLVALWLCKNVFTYGAVEFTGYMTYHSLHSGNVCWPFRPHCRNWHTVTSCIHWWN